MRIQFFPNIFISGLAKRLFFTEFKVEGVSGQYCVFLTISFVRPKETIMFFVSVCPFTFEVPFKRLFAPTSRSRMSNIFRDSESLGKSNGKKCSQIGTFLFENCLKSPRKKKDIFCWFCLTKHAGNHASQWIRYLWSKGVSLILAYL